MEYGSGGLKCGLRCEGRGQTVPSVEAENHEDLDHDVTIPSQIHNQTVKEHPSHIEVSTAKVFQ